MVQLLFENGLSMANALSIRGLVLQSVAATHSQMPKPDPELWQESDPEFMETPALQHITAIVTMIIATSIIIITMIIMILILTIINKALIQPMCRAQKTWCQLSLLPWSGLLHSPT